MVHVGKRICHFLLHDYFPHNCNAYFDLEIAHFDGIRINEPFAPAEFVFVQAYLEFRFYVRTCI